MQKSRKEIPVTQVESKEGKRNIARRINKGTGGSGKAKKNFSIDDGSLYQGGPAFDSHDPNYDSEEEIGNEFIPRVSNLRQSVAQAPITITKYKKSIEPLISEYFISADSDDILNSLMDLDSPQYAYEFIKRSVNMSFDKGDRERELISKLFSIGYPDHFSSNMVGKGFERLFELVDEIEKDAPNARNMLSTYVTRAVVDEIIPPSFLSDAVVCNLGGEIIEHAKRMLSRDHAGAMLERGWGPGDGRPVEEMKVAVDHLLQEFLISGDLDEAVRCISELQAPQFYHEIVKRAVVCALDKTEIEQLQMSSLLDYLVERDLLTKLQATKGFNRLHVLVNELCLDTPAAKQILADFLSRAIEGNVLEANYVPEHTDDLPPAPSLSSSM